MKLSDFDKCVTSIATRRITGVTLGAIAAFALLGTDPSALAQTDPDSVPGECKASCEYEDGSSYDWDFSSDDDVGSYDPGWTAPPPVDPRIEAGRNLNLQGIDAWNRRQEPGQLEKAEDFFRRALEYENHPTYRDSLANVLNSKAVRLHAAGYLDMAISQYEEALRWATGAERIAFVRSNLAQARAWKAWDTAERYELAGDYEAAQQSYKNALNHYEVAMRDEHDSTIRSELRDSRDRVQSHLNYIREILERRQREQRVAAQEGKISDMVADVAGAWDSEATPGRANAGAGLDFMGASASLESSVNSGEAATGELAKLSGDFSPGNTGRTPDTEASQGRREIALGSGAKGQAKAASASGKVAVAEPTVEGVAEEARCAFDGSCIAVPAGANDPNAVVIGSGSEWEEEVPESVKSTPRWQALEREAQKLEKERAVTQKKIAEIEKKLETVSDEERPQLQVELVKAREADDKVNNKQLKNVSDKRVFFQDFTEQPAGEAAAGTDPSATPPEN